MQGMASRADSAAAVRNDHGLLAKPLHLQRLERAVRLDPFLDYVQTVFNTQSDVDNGERSPSDVELDESLLAAAETSNSYEERKCERAKLYNFDTVKKNRTWLKDMLLSDSTETGESEDSFAEDDLQDMLRLHKMRKNAHAEFLANPELKQFQYYSTGLLSNYDRFYDHQKVVLGNKKKTKDKNVERKKVKMKKKSEGEKDNKGSQECSSQGGRKSKIKAEDGPSDMTHHHSKKKKSAASHEAVMTLKRKRLWIAIGKKEINRAVKQNAAIRKEVLTSAKKLAQSCQKEVRKAALLSQKVQKDVSSRARRLTKEMLLYWKRYEKVEKEHRKKAEKEAQEKLKMDIELREAKRQQRKLNFLITQTELYAHFMSRKISNLQDVQQEQILSQLDEPKQEPHVSTNFLFASADDEYDCEEMKVLAVKNADEAYKIHVSQTTSFDESLPPDVKVKSLESREEFDESLKLSNPVIKLEKEHLQPEMFQGTLKTYQLKGMNWLYSLYDKGINGILADEMGLGKTVQTIAFLATLVKAQGIWGPFLIIAPASTLHNWQQEFTKFVPNFKVLPYWGNTSDRKVLRKFWSQKDLHTENASFHVLITSYQLVVQDVKYFQRIKWQYMVLDEAQAIKSTSSVRWKILLGFNCRNRLLLTGTPIQNSMAELWALLHFIMPTLFDSHEEFNEWFSRDIESHAENKSVIDEKHLSRLHKILKPFMLRRVKKDVENELSDKIEILMYCQLTQRQKLLYQNLRNKISIDDLMQSSSASSSAQSATSSLLNLVMQFRKVCNHPDLFERREVKHSFHMRLSTYSLPKLLYREGILHLNDSSRNRLLLCLGILHPEYIHHELFPQDCTDSIYHFDCGFSFTRFIDVSPAELSQLFLSGLLPRWIAAYLVQKSAYRICHDCIWHKDEAPWLRHKMFILSPLAQIFRTGVNVCAFTPLLFVNATSTVYSFINHMVYPKQPTKKEIKIEVLEDSESQQNCIAIIGREQRVMDCQLTHMPTFLSDMPLRVVAAPFSIYSPDRSAELWYRRQQLCGTAEALKMVIYGCPSALPENAHVTPPIFNSWPLGGVSAYRPPCGFSKIVIPDKETLVTDSGKLTVLDNLLKRLKAEGHRVLIYSQMTRMIDLLEEYMWHRKHTYIRLDGSSKISDRRDMVADFQARSDIFVFLLSTRAGGLGINLTAADTVIFYDSDWNPTVDQQAMDRAHRLGQTKQVTVYRLVCKGSIEERILERAREKSEIQRMVISGGNFKPDTLKPKEVVSLLLDDDELERKFRIRQEERKLQLQEKSSLERKRKHDQLGESKRGRKRKPKDENLTTPAVCTPVQDDSLLSIDSVPPSPFSEHSASSNALAIDDNSSDAPLVVDDSSPSTTPAPYATSSITGKVEEGSSPVDLLPQLKKRGTGRGRGRPRGPGRRGNGRGRGNLLATAAAELAGAQAGKSAAFAAYGYSIQDGKCSEGSPPVPSCSLGRGSRGRGSFSARAISLRGRGLLRGTPKTFPSKSISLGFYMPGPHS